MSAVAMHSGDNYGGLRSLHYMFMQSVPTFVVAASASTVNIPQGVFTANFHRIDFLHVNGEYNQRRANGAHGPAFELSVGLRLLKDRADIRDQIDKVGDRKLWLYMVNQNGEGLFVGAPNEGIVQSENFASGRTVSNAPAYDYLFSDIFSVKIRPAAIIPT